MLSSRKQSLLTSTIRPGMPGPAGMTLSVVWGLITVAGSAGVARGACNTPGQPQFTITGGAQALSFTGAIHHCNNTQELGGPGTVGPVSCVSEGEGFAHSSITISQSGFNFVITGTATAQKVSEPTAKNFHARASGAVTVRAVNGPVQVTVTNDSPAVRDGVVTPNTSNDTFILTEANGPIIMGGGCSAEAVGVGASSTCTGTATIRVQPATPDPVTSYAWAFPFGGPYNDVANWLPDCDFPQHSGGRSDTAIFPPVDPNVILVDVSGATAGNWIVTGNFETSGNAQLFSTQSSPPSLAVRSTGQLRHIAGTLTSVNTKVGDAGGLFTSKLGIANAGTTWINPGFVQIGVKNVGEVEIDNASVESGGVILGGSSGNAAGVLQLHGPSASWTASGIEIGNTAAAGTLTIGDGASLNTSDPSTIDGAIGQAGNAAILGESGEGTPSSWEHDDVLEVAPSGVGNLRVENGGFLTAEELRIGNASGSSGSVRVKGLSPTGQNAFADISERILVGHDQGTGLLEILDGAAARGNSCQIGCSGSGTVLVSGSSNPGDLSDLNSFATLTVSDTISAGCGLGGGEGRLTVANGGGVQAPVISVTGGGQIVLDGQGGRALLQALNRLVVDALQSVEIEARDGGKIITQELILGRNVLQPGAADLTLRGRNASGAPTSLHVLDVPGDAESAKVAQIGATAPGQLNILSGARAELKGGLTVGQGAQGIVVISNTTGPDTSHLVIDGETQIGVGGTGILQAESFSDVTSNGAFQIGLGAGVPSGSVSLDHSSRLDVNGTLSVGVGGQGLLTVGASGFDCRVECDTLLVGGAVTAATGTIILRHDAKLDISGNAQVGLDAGRGEILLADRDTRLNINGTLTIGSPNGGSAGGAVILSDARIEGTGSIVVNPNGCLQGTGVVSLPKVRNSACISPGFSPGRITIDGDYVQEDGGRLIIEVGGLEPGRFDVLEVTGSATLGGILDLRFIDGFVPRPGDSVEFLQVTGQITGQLSAVSTVIDVPGDRDTAHPAARAEVALALTPNGAVRMTVTRVRTLDESGNVVATEEITGSEIADGTSNTILVGETPTTRPEEGNTRPSVETPRGRIADGTGNTIIVDETRTSVSPRGNADGIVDAASNTLLIGEEVGDPSGDEEEPSASPPAAGVCGVGVAPLVPMAILGCLGRTCRARSRRLQRVW